jgi:hypothetical protein
MDWIFLSKEISGMNQRTRLLVARCCIGLVLFINLNCAVRFLANPQIYKIGFELTGTPGNAMVQGMGLLFIMWNVPYVFALLQPVKNRISMIESLIMQLIGVLGETFFISHLPGLHPNLHTTINRFILFDGAGFVILLFAFQITRHFILSNPSKPVNQADNC